MLFNIGREKCSQSQYYLHRDEKIYLVLVLFNIGAGSYVNLSSQYQELVF